MVRFAWLVTLVGCAHGVSEPNPPTPPPAKSVPYTGRIVLATDALRDQVDDFASAWTRRIEILGITAKITYDDNRAVIDVYDTAPAQLERIANVLVDHGEFRIDGYFFDGALVTWLPPTASCNCSGRARVSLDSTLLCVLTSGEHTIERSGFSARMQGKKFWRHKDSIRYFAYPPEQSPCRGEGWWPDNIVFELPLESSRDTNVGLVLALAGGTLPDAPRIASITAETP